VQLLLPPEITSQLAAALAQAGLREIGGILMGEHVGPDRFRVREVTVQRRGGTFAEFVRIVSEILAPLRAFFDTTQHNYQRFNYMGEWHSHHSFELRPSGRDHATMCEMVTDPKLGAHFVVLLLVKLGADGELQGAVTVYQPNRNPYGGSVAQERLPPT
jgi:[CysO sulfur-carrier protein]-S-L-cysteine hydrolase